MASGSNSKPAANSGCDRNFAPDGPALQRQTCLVCHRFQKAELALADGHDIPVMQLLAVDPDGVHEYAVRAAEILDYDAASR
jgi:hypothetical protein